VIGGHPTCTVVLADSTVENHHVRLTIREGGAVVLDLGTANGTFVNDARIEQGVDVDVSDTIRIGETTLELEAADILPERRIERRHVVQPGVEEGFLARLREEPSDDATREIYADWLDSIGAPTPAAFIRLQLAGTATIETSDVIERATTLTDPGWRAVVSRGRIHHCESPCPGRWHMLEPTEVDTSRFCPTCREDVRYCATLEEIASCGRRDAPCVYDARLIERRADEAYEVPTVTIR
jgi:uncharacterized protein (TIGR02996 family)